MRYEDKLKEGLTIDLEVNEGVYQGKYRSKISEIKPGLIIIEVPIHDGQFVPLRDGTSIKIFFYDDTSGYAFVSQIIKRMTVSIPIFIIKYPEQINKIQRRIFYRIPVVAEIEYQIVGTEGLSKIYKGYTNNLSGGGLLLKTTRKIPENSLMFVTLKLDNKEIKLSAKVIRCVQEDNNLFLIAMEFCDISECQRDIIIAYIYQMQRLMLRKGLE
ncbi:MAG: flagellar brake protein [Bacillota bacterium]|jgi:c-di-GMP-binding flagellar brake protein YcgR